MRNLSSILSWSNFSFPLPPKKIKGNSIDGDCNESKRENSCRTGCYFRVPGDFEIKILLRRSVGIGPFPFMIGVARG